MKAPKRVRRVLKRLDGVTPTGQPHQWMARCPTHDDRKQSLAVGYASSKVKLFCHANGKDKDGPCTWTKILKKIKLTPADLGSADSGDGPAEEITYDFTDAEGRLVFQEVRQGSGADKRVYMRRPDPESEGEWVNNLKGVTPLLYRLPSLKGAKRVYVVEGPKDAESLRTLGLTATTNSNGAGKWRQAHTDQLRQHAPDAELILLKDNDDPGEKHRQATRASVSAAGFTLRVVDLPGVDDKEDVTDWIGAGHTRKELEQLVDKAEMLRPPGARAFGSVVREYLERQGDPARRAVAYSTGIDALDKVLDGGLLPSKLTYLGGPTSVGKSLLAWQIVDHVARQGKPVAFYSLELTGDQLTERALSRDSEVSTRKIREQEFTKKERQRVLEAAVALDRLPIFVESNFLTLEQIERDILAHPERAVAVVDYLQLVFTGGKFDRGRTAIEAVSATFMQLRKRTPTHLIVLSSVNGDGELRESRQLAFDADNAWVMGAGHDEDDAFEKEDLAGRDRHIQIRKHRDGQGRGQLVLLRQDKLRLVPLKSKANDEEEEETGGF